MNRAERRHRTECVRNRRIDLYSQIDAWCWFKREDSHANYIRNRGWRWKPLPTEEVVLKEMEEDRQYRLLLEAKMRNEYMPGYRDNDWVNRGREKKMRIADADLSSWLTEFGINNDLRPRRKHRYFN